MTQFPNNLGYGLGHMDITDLWTMLAQIADTGDYAYTIDAAHSLIEQTISPHIADYNTEFNYPNDLEVIAETRPLKLATTWFTKNPNASTGPGVMRAIIYLEKSVLSIDYNDTVGITRTAVIPVEQGTVVVFPSKLMHRADHARVYADFKFNLNAEFSEKGYVIPTREAPAQNLRATK